MAKPNYSFEKRQRELAKKKKKEEKLKEKAGRKVGSESGEPDDGEPSTDGTSDAPPAENQSAP
ncbi:MAG TPA: hypothetical protein VE029_05090 [Rhizobacter sp.]|nr:hypothetical protein [Rhizobacter sp.]